MLIPPDASVSMTAAAGLSVQSRTSKILSRHATPPITHDARQKDHSTKRGSIRMDTWAVAIRTAVFVNQTAAAVSAVWWRQEKSGKGFRPLSVHLSMINTAHRSMRNWVRDSGLHPVFHVYLTGRMFVVSLLGTDMQVLLVNGLGDQDRYAKTRGDEEARLKVLNYFFAIRGISVGEERRILPPSDEGDRNPLIEVGQLLTSLLQQGIAN